MSSGVCHARSKIYIAYACLYVKEVRAYVCIVLFSAPVKLKEEEEGRREGVKLAAGVHDERVKSLQVVALAHCLPPPLWRNCTLDSDLMNNPGLL